MSKYDKFSQRLKELRTNMNLTQRQFSQKIGCTQTTLSAYENTPKSPSLDIIIDIAEKCNVSVDWLLGLSDNVSNNEITSYKQIIEFLFKLKNKDGFHRLEIDTDNNAIFLNNKKMNEFLKDWDKMLSVNNVFDDNELYQLWIEKTLAKYDVEIQKSDVFFDF